MLDSELHSKAKDTYIETLLYLTDAWVLFVTVDFLKLLLFVDLAQRFIPSSR
jgi:hypothetical protein